MKRNVMKENYKNEQEQEKLNDYLSELLSIKSNRGLILHETLCDIALGQCDLLVSGKNKKVNFNSIQIVIEDMHPEVIGVGYVKGIVKRLPIKDFNSTEAAGNRSSLSSDKVTVKENMLKLTTQFLQYDYLEYQGIQRQSSMIFSSNSKYIGYAKIVDDNEPDFYIICFLVLEAVGSKSEAYNELHLDQGETFTINDEDIDACAKELFGVLPALQRSISKKDIPQIRIDTTPQLPVNAVAATFSNSPYSPTSSGKFQLTQLNTDALSPKASDKAKQPSFGADSVSASTASSSHSISTQQTKMSSNSNPIPVVTPLTTSISMSTISQPAPASTTLQKSSTIPNTNTVDPKERETSSEAENQSKSKRGSVTSWFGSLLKPHHSNSHNNQQSKTKGEDVKEKSNENPWADVKLKSVQSGPEKEIYAYSSETIYTTSSTSPLPLSSPVNASPKEKVLNKPPLSYASSSTSINGTSSSSATADSKILTPEGSQRKLSDNPRDSFKERSDSQKNSPSWANMKLNPVSSPLSRGASDKKLQLSDDEKPIISPMNSSPQISAKAIMSDPSTTAKPSIADIKKKFERANSSPLSPEISKRNLSSRNLQETSPSQTTSTTTSTSPSTNSNSASLGVKASVSALAAVTSSASMTASSDKSGAKPSFNIDEIRKKFGTPSSTSSSTKQSSDSSSAKPSITNPNATDASKGINGDSSGSVNRFGVTLRKTPSGKLL